MVHSPQTDALEEKLRRANECLLEARLEKNNADFRLNQVITSLRWWAVAYLIWMFREIIDPARYILNYTDSWTYKLAMSYGHPTVLVLWFGICAALVIPLIFFLIFAHSHALREKSEDYALAGLALAAIGYAFLASAAMRLDIPHVVDSYILSTVMLASTALLVACWHNAKMVRAAHEAERLDKEPTCCEMAL